jgi:hypothetical protein
MKLLIKLTGSLGAPEKSPGCVTKFSLRGSGEKFRRMEKSVAW